MKGLLYKDILTLCKTRLLYMYLLIVVFAPHSTNNVVMVMFPCFFAAVLPMTLLSYDEKSRWDVFTQTLPVTRAQLVHAKYVVGLCLIVGFSLLSVVSKSIAWRIQSMTDEFHPINSFLVMIAFGMIVNAAMMPFIFKFGIEKGTTIYYVMLGFCGVLAGVYYGLFGSDFNGVFSVSFVPGLFIIAVAVMALSWKLSVRFYTDREL